MAKDLRTFIDRVERGQPKGIRRVKQEVSPEFEISAILRKLQHRGEYPLVIFERVKGSDIPVVTNVIAENASNTPFYSVFTVFSSVVASQTGASGCRCTFDRVAGHRANCAG